MYREDMTPHQEFVANVVIEEFLKASNRFPPFNSDHEGYAIILEEVDELWEAVKNNKRTSNLDRIKEAIQVSAMTLRYVHDLATGATCDVLDRGSDFENSN